MLHHLHLHSLFPHTSTAIVSPQTTPSIMPPLLPISSLLPPSSVASSSDTLPLLPQDAVATSSQLQQFSAVRQLTLQKRKPRHPKRPQLSPGEAGTPTKRIVHDAGNKQKLTHYNYALNLYKHYLNQLLTEQAVELDKIIKIVTSLVNHFTPILAQLKSYQENTPNYIP